MPPLNHTTDLQRDGSVYVVRVMERNKESYPNGTYERDRHLCSSLEAAITAALSEHDDDPLIHQLSLGSLILDERHDGDEVYLRTTLSEKRVYGQR